MTASGAGLDAAARPDGQRQPPLRRLRGNSRVMLDIWPGTIHGLIGRNGAGKSTLMRLLYGLERPDEGIILVDGQPVSFRGPADALALGIGMVHQHFMLIPTLSVLDNIMLGSEPGRGGWLDRRAARARLLERAGDAAAGLDLARRVEDLSVGEQQRVEILKLLYRDARLLILDEPTAVLSPREIRGLLGDLIHLSAPRPHDRLHLAPPGRGARGHRPRVGAAAGGSRGHACHEEPDRGPPGERSGEGRRRAAGAAGLRGGGRPWCLRPARRCWNWRTSTRRAPRAAAA
jgi:ABC-type lipoprotein export system ATPase subunit